MMTLNLIDLVNEFVSLMVTLVVVDVVAAVDVDDGADLNDVATVFANFHSIDHWQHKQQP